MVTLQNLMNYSVSDIPDKKERTESLTLLRALFTPLHREISRSNLFSAIVCATTTNLAGITPIAPYLLFPKPFGTVLSLGIVGAVVGVFLVRYRAKRSKVHWKITFFETVVMVAIAVIASLIIGRTV